MDQANRLRGMIRDRAGDSPRRTGRIIAVASGKGGVGKSVVALNLATAFARRGRDVALIDADLGLGSLEILSGVSVQWNLSHVATGAKPLDEVFAETGYGVRVAAGANGLTTLADASASDCKRVLAAIIDAARDFDDVVIDLSSGIDATVRSFLDTADEILVVTTPDPTAIANAYALVKSFDAAAGPVRLLVNLADSAEQAGRIFERFQVTAAQFAGVTVLDAGHLPRDLSIARAVMARAPVVISEPRTPAAKGIERLASRLLETHPLVTSSFAEPSAPVSPTVAAA